MAYADTDFFLALFKKEDWLKTNAEKILEQHRGQIETDFATFVEISLICKRIGANLEDVFRYIFSISRSDYLTLEECVQIASYIQSDGMNPIDAFQAVLSRDRTIISSDSKYDDIGLQRIKREKK